MSELYEQTTSVFYDNEERYIVCDNCNEKIDCWNCNIYCLYKECQTKEITICQMCNDDLIEEFKEEGYNCDDWDESDDESNCLFNYYICRYCDNITINDNPDCSKCKKEVCMELFQAENQADAMCKKKI